MQLTSIGHLSWSVCAGDTHVLVDPLLGEGFGSDPGRPFHIVPARMVCLEDMPPVDAIILTTEHLQHFHPATLARLQREFPHKLKTLRVYVPQMFPQAARDLLHHCGYEIHVMDIRHDVQVGELTCRFYMPYTDVLFWDSRVASLYLRDTRDQSVFIQSDTRIADSFYADVSAGTVPSPRVMVVTNNFQSSAEGQAIGLDNLLPVADPKYARISGLRLLNEIISQPARKLDKSVILVIAGNGYLDKDRKIRHLWSNAQLAGIASQLSLLSTVHALDPGESLDAGTACPGQVAGWIAPTEPSRHWLSVERLGCGPRTSLVQVKEHLDEMARTWLITGYGQSLMTQTHYLGRPLGARRLVIQLMDEGRQSIDFVLDVSRVEFVRVDSLGARAIKQYPFGIRVDLRDFKSLLAGELQVWELLNLSASQWYVCDRYDSPLAFWLEFYSEQVDSERARRSYQLSLDSVS
ncbi:hypothetical protein DLD99_13410 [Pseudomonas kribbensis]|uniref:Metallo-beta-lactamase domain-containing protein n=1 Tax=Pseudomonas kribbensis TaxID=1628086 RepID=A0A345RQ59_9PSED|nr:MBL fold metallo-hydrolase [Pseudomonas kribbensis]AXI61425.1 hypothetical protein DLD99_13410 [Pseudomonas kribbensis]